MKIFLTLLIFLFVSSSIYAQENASNKKVSNAKSIDIRANSRQQAIVKRDNFHPRRDIRTQQINRMIKRSKNQRIKGKRSLIKKKSKKSDIQHKMKLTNTLSKEIIFWIKDCLIRPLNWNVK